MLRTLNLANIALNARYVKSYKKPVVESRMFLIQCHLKSNQNIYIKLSIIQAQILE